MTDNTSWFAKPDEHAPSAHGRAPRERTWGERFRGAVFGGAVGDALGAAVRHRTTEEIQRWFGSQGVVDYLPIFGVRGAATDLSQLTVFTLEALLRARAANPESGGRLPPEFVATSHLRWLHTQGVPWQYAMSAHLAAQPEPGGWLLGRPELFSTRDPAGVALRGLGELAATPPGAAAEPPLGSASAVEPIVWAAPAMAWSGSEESVFAAGASIAGLLTGDPSTTGAAGLHCDVLTQVIRGVQLWDAVSASDVQRLGRAHGASNPADVRRTVHAAMFASHGARPPGPSELDTEFDTDGRPGELGIALASVACSDGFAGAVRMAINQSADSCVAGALAGQLAGALHGPDAIPVHWLEELELGEVLGTLCEDAVEAFAPPPLPKWAQRYVPDTKRAFSGPLELPGSAPPDGPAVDNDAVGNGAGTRGPGGHELENHAPGRRPHPVVSERVNPSSEPVPEQVFPEPAPEPSAHATAESGAEDADVSDVGTIDLGRADLGEADLGRADPGEVVEISPAEETTVLPMMGFKPSSGGERLPAREQPVAEASEPVPAQRATAGGRARTGHPLVELGDPPELDAGPSEPDPASPSHLGPESAGSPDTGSGRLANPQPGHLEAGSLAAEPETSVVEEIEEPFAPAPEPQPEAVEPQPSEPQPSKPQPSESQRQPGLAAPEPAAPEPEQVDLGPADPPAGETRHAEAEAADPEAAETQPAGTQQAGTQQAVPSRAASGGGHAKLEDQEPAGPSLTERVLGCLLGGGLGNALAAGLEASSSQQISAAFGADGPHDLGELEGVRGAITDATQLTLFTAEGLIRASTGRRTCGTADPLAEVRLAYQRWLHTQGVEWASAAGTFRADYPRPDGWLIEVPGLFAARSPGRTTVNALADFGRGGRAGTLEEKTNDSKGCAAAMRAAPVSLHSADPSEVFELAAGAAACTHGHPSGYLPAGALAVIVQQALLGRGLDDGVWLALQVLETWEEHEETTAMLKVAVDLASRGVPTPQEIEQTLGDGWVGEQALAIAVCAALVGGQDVQLALRVAVHHSGDSAATGAICGNIAGALLGVAELPMSWLADLELRDVVEQVALDCVAEFGMGDFLGGGHSPDAVPGPPDDEDWHERYPVRPPRSDDGTASSGESTQRVPLPGSRELAESTALGGGAFAARTSGRASAAPSAGQESAGQESPGRESTGEGGAGPAQDEVGALAASSAASSDGSRLPEEPEAQRTSAGASTSSSGDGSPEGDAEASGGQGEQSASELRAPKPAPRRINGFVAEQGTE